MRLLDSRRLRGPNLQTREPAAVAEVAFEAGEGAKACVRAWRKHAGRMCRALGWRASDKSLVARPFPGGAAFAIVAPIDVLLEATDVNEWAIEAASGRVGESFARTKERLLERVERHANPRLVALRKAA